MASSPDRYFYSVRGAEKLSKSNFKENEQKHYKDQIVPYFYTKERKSKENVDKILTQTMRESLIQKEKTKLKEKNKNEFSSIDNLEFLKKIYKPRKLSKEKFNDIKSAILRNKILKQFETDPQDKKQTNRKNSKKTLTTNFRIRSEKNATLPSLHSYRSLNNLPIYEEIITGKIKEKGYENNGKKELLEKKNDSAYFPENDKIKQNSTYKMIETKAMEILSKKDNNIKNLPSFETKNDKITEENKNQSNENQLKITNQPNSFNISVNLKPTFNLSLNSAMQKLNKKLFKNSIFFTFLAKTSNKFSSLSN